MPARQETVRTSAEWILPAPPAVRPATVPMTAVQLAICHASTCILRDRTGLVCRQALLDYNPETRLLEYTVCMPIRPT